MAPSSTSHRRSRAGERADYADESIGVAEIKKRRFQFGKRFDKAFEPFTRDASLSGRERPLERRIRVDVAGPGVDIADREPAEPRFDTDRQPVAVLIVKHLVRLRRADTHNHREERHTSLATQYPQHLLPPRP